MNARAELAAFRQFLKAPRRRPAHDDRGWLARCLLFALLATSVSLTLGLALTPLSDWARAVSEIPDRPGPGLVFVILVVAPIGEELAFRAGLRHYAYALFFGPALIGLGLGAAAGAWWLALAFAAAPLLVGLAHRWRVSRRAGARFAAGRSFVTRYRWVFWGCTAAFGLAHLANFQYGGPRSALLPLLVLPQFSIGIALAYLRLRDNLRSAMLLHFLNNLVAVAAMFTAD